MNCLYVFLPCYNEAPNISALIANWNLQRAPLEQSGYLLQILAIDDCSKDATKQKILEQAEVYDNVTLIAHEQNKGLVGGINTALMTFKALGSQGDRMALMDGDNTHDPAYIHGMLKKLQNNKDCVIASRYCSDSSVVGLARHRQWLSILAKAYYTLLLRIPHVQDYTCGYRVYTYAIIAKLVDDFGDAPIREQSFACMMELLYKLHLVGARCDEVGFQLRYDNKKGQSKMRVVSTSFHSVTAAFRLRALKRKRAKGL